jgi:hypothetical protein
VIWIVTYSGVKWLKFLTLPSKIHFETTKKLKLKSGLSKFHLELFFDGPNEQF